MFSTSEECFRVIFCKHKIATPEYFSHGEASHTQTQNWNVPHVNYKLNLFSYTWKHYKIMFKINKIIYTL